MKIPIDKSRIPQNVAYFDNLSAIDVEKDELFKIGIFKQEIPSNHIYDTDYLYLLSRVAAYAQIYGDFVDTSSDSIVNLSTDDRMMKDISEIVGIALGLKLTIDCFSIRQEVISKIPPPAKKAKYLDYKFIHNAQQFELETKGTTSTSIQNFIDDILAKKAASTGAQFRFGTVSILSKPGKTHKSIIHLCDDPPVDSVSSAGESGLPWHYLSALGYLIDNKYYNDLIKSLTQGKKLRKKTRNLKEHFFGSFKFRNENYYGEFFDYRVNIENLAAVVTGKEQTIDVVLDKITKKQGRKKIFIGIKSPIIDQVLRGCEINEIIKPEMEVLREVTDTGVSVFRDSDGIIVAISTDKEDPQIEKQFTEDEVKRRIAQMLRMSRHEALECGSPCRSRDKEGKPCEIKTFRGTCHFHR